MTDTTPEDDGLPAVRYELRNVEGNDGEVELRRPILGLDRYLLVRPGDDAIELEASHLDTTGVAEILALLLATTLQDEDVTAETRETAVRLVTHAADLAEGD